VEKSSAISNRIAVVNPKFHSVLMRHVCCKWEAMEVLDVSFTKFQCLCVLLGISTFLTGCGSSVAGPTTVPVRGVVKYNGKPVEKLSIAFIPESGMLAMGKTDAKGQFQLMTNKPSDGAMTGNYKVAISFVSDAPPPMPGLPGSSDYKAPLSPIPTKYADANTSGLTKTVDKDSSKNNFEFDLVD
jgi:hypothetical protein